LKKVAYQSSDKDMEHYHADAAVDGITNGILRDGSCSHTRADQDAWWAVDLGTRFQVHAVLISNRADCCSKLLETCYIYMADSVFILYTLVKSLLWQRTVVRPCADPGFYINFLNN
jgi:hypothetical protein